MNLGLTRLKQTDGHTCRHVHRWSTSMGGAA